MLVVRFGERASDAEAVRCEYVGIRMWKSSDQTFAADRRRTPPNAMMEASQSGPSGPTSFAPLDVVSATWQPFWQPTGRDSVN